jgi:hypothetical protein
MAASAAEAPMAFREARGMTVLGEAILSISHNL